MGVDRKITVHDWAYVLNESEHAHDIDSTKFNGVSLRQELVRLYAVESDLAASRQRVANSSRHPDVCPVTGREFFMVIEAENGDMVATYGGPYDSYTIPAWDPDDKEFRSERYDHDRGEWVEGGEPYPFELIHSERLIAMEQQLASREAALREIRDMPFPTAITMTEHRVMREMRDRAAQEVGRGTV